MKRPAKPSRLIGALSHRESLERLHSTWLMSIVAVGLEMRVPASFLGITIIIAVAVRDHIVTILFFDLEQAAEKVREEVSPP